MEQVQAVGHARVFQLLQRAHRFAHRKSELGTVAARRAPTAGAAAGQLHAQPDHGPHAHPLGVAQNKLQLRILLDHRNNVAPQLLRQHGHLDVFVVLEAVADDGRFVVGHGHHGHQFGLGSRLQAELERTAELQHFFHNLPLLIDLDGVHATIFALVAMFGDGGLKSPVQFAQAVLQNAGETHQHRQRDAAQHQGIDQLFQIDGALRILGGMHAQVAAAVHRKVALAPTGHVVEFAGVLRCPSLRRLHDERAFPGVLLHSCLQSFSVLRIGGKGKGKMMVGQASACRSPDCNIECVRHVKVST